jgi:hypothetical protein
VVDAVSACAAMQCARACTDLGGACARKACVCVRACARARACVCACVRVRYSLGRNFRSTLPCRDFSLSAALKWSGGDVQLIVKTALPLRNPACMLTVAVVIGWPGPGPSRAVEIVPSSISSCIAAGHGHHGMQHACTHVLYRSLALCLLSPLRGGSKGQQPRATA